MALVRITLLAFLKQDIGFLHYFRHYRDSLLHWYKQQTPVLKPCWTPFYQVPNPRPSLGAPLSRHFTPLHNALLFCALLLVIRSVRQR